MIRDMVRPKFNVECRSCTYSTQVPNYRTTTVINHESVEGIQYLDAELSKRARLITH